MADAVKPFLDWVSKRQELWRNFHFSAIALRVRGEWFCVAGGVLLAPSGEQPDPGGSPIFETPDLCTIRLTASVDQLPSILSDVQKGIVLEGRIPGLDRTLRIECPAGTPLAEEGGHEYTSPGVRSYSQGDRLRFQATFSGAAVGKLFTDQLEAQELLQQVDREWQAEGYGSVSEICHTLRLRATPSEAFNLGTYVTFRLEAGLPFRLLDCKQGEDRKAVLATVEIDPVTPRENIKVVYRSKELGRPLSKVAIPAGGPLITFVVADAPPVGPGEVIISSAKEKVDSINVVVRPPLKIWPGLVAMSALEQDLALLRDGLTGRDATRHERAVAHLFGLVGFSTFWWGPQHQAEAPAPAERRSRRPAVLERPPNRDRRRVHDRRAARQEAALAGRADKWDEAQAAGGLRRGCAVCPSPPSSRETATSCPRTCAPLYGTTMPAY